MITSSVYNQESYLYIGSHAVGGCSSRNREQNMFFKKLGFFIEPIICQFFYSYDAYGKQKYFEKSSNFNLQKII